MRQDVKLGLAIGGILLAVLIVYVLVVPGDNGASDVQLVDANGNAVTDASTPETLDLTQSDEPTDTSEAIEAPQAVSTPETAPATDPFEARRDETISTPTQVADSGSDAPHDWAELLSGEARLPALMTETPIMRSQPAAPEPVAPMTPSVMDPAASAGLETPAAPTPVASESTYVVASGDTLSSISTKVYGSANYYPHIQRANPGINPNRLKVGTALKIPPLADVRTSQPQAVQASAETALDTARQYKVGRGDSLYTISMKLYGKADRVTALYEANKATIGADPAKLKVGTVLTLPEAPTTASR